MITSLERIESCLYGLEKTFNILECVPIVANFSAGARCAVGQLQIITGIALCVFASVTNQLAKNPKWHLTNRLLVKFALGQILHGVANMVRGIAAAKLFMGPVIFITYDLVGCRFRYKNEERNWQRQPVAFQ